MPFVILKQSDGGYKVCKRDNPKICFSIKGIPLENAKKQMSAIGISEKKGGAMPSNPDLYEKVKEKVMKKNPKHSAYRSMQIVKEYKKEGGEYDNNGERNTKKWLGQNWSSVNDYYHNDEVVKCGNSDTKEKFGEYPLCRPLSIIKKLTKKQMKEMIDNKKDKTPLITEKILKTKKYNIKNTKTGAGAEPDERDFNQLAKGAYDGSVPPNYQLIDQSPTIKIYKKNDDNTLVISVRGSADLRDWKTNFTALPFNTLNNSNRYIEDKKFVGDAIQKYSNGNDIYITAHSLGGAVADQLQKDFPQIKSGLSFNPAYQTKDFFTPPDTTIKRKYHQDDVLGMLGRYLPQSTVETQKPQNFIEKVIGKRPSLFDRLKGHLLSAFESSKTGGTAYKDFNDAGIQQITKDRYQASKNNKKVDYLQPSQNNNLRKPIDIQTNNDDANKRTVINVYNGSGAGRIIGGNKFFNQLEKLKIDHKQYLKIAKDRAKQKGYDPKLLFFSTDGIHKLEYDNIPFGRVGYKDYIIYTLTDPKKAEQARNRFHKSHSKINDSGRFSPNQLALNINW